MGGGEIVSGIVSTGQGGYEDGVKFMKNQAEVYHTVVF